ncbi:hypothetical protein [Corynebacterium belfantii]|uniref:hypothetical protein n=1 Tax=Corynebacterium belfantii TaxID=2014537 RepID=UPI0018CAD3DA|nr:hypothetical protein [Corynebacterium belfantii]MBG9288974.1 hypothetical protein [Corynebacterium belfantii]
MTTDQISRLSIRDEKFSETTEAGTGGEQQSEPLKVNTVKAGDRQVTGLAFLLPKQEKTVQAIFPGIITRTQDLRFDQSSAESGDTSMGRFVPFKIDVPDEVTLKKGDVLLFNLRPSDDGENKNIKVVVKSADNGNGQAPGGGAGDNSPKPPAPGGGAGDNPRTGGGSSSFGSS